MKITLARVRRACVLVVEKVVDLWRRRDVEAFKEDLRKLGMLLAGGGLIGLIIQADQVTLFEGITLLVTGTILWIYGIQRGDEDGD